MESSYWNHIEKSVDALYRKRIDWRLRVFGNDTNRLRFSNQLITDKISRWTKIKSETQNLIKLNINLEWGGKNGEWNYVSYAIIKLCLKMARYFEGGENRRERSYLLWLNECERCGIKNRAATIINLLSIHGRNQNCSVFFFIFFYLVWSKAHRSRVYIQSLRVYNCLQGDSCFVIIIISYIYIFITQTKKKQ